jgi:diacylglycerol kinase (ATP)
LIYLKRLELYRNTPNLRVLVGGGDGTVGWVLSVLDQIYFREAPSIAVLPLGTGNDLSRSLNWGSGYTDESLVKILNKVLNSRQVMLDRWKIKIEQNFIADTSETSSTSLQSFRLKNDVMNNYFSIGADAHVCLDFHSKREANPEKYTKRWINKLQYFEAGSRDLIKQSWKDLSEFTQLICDGNDYTNKIQQRAYHCIIFLNIPKYSSGTNPWGSHTSAQFRTQAYDDGYLEIIGCFTGTLTKLQLGGYGERICQAKSIKLITCTEIPMQIDGEPFRVPPSVIEITLKNQTQMLECIKNSKISSISQAECLSSRTKFEIKCISLSDYHLSRCTDDPKLTYSLGYMDFDINEKLKCVRDRIDLYFKKTNDSRYPQKWSFLNGIHMSIKCIKRLKLCILKKFFLNFSPFN